MIVKYLVSCSRFLFIAVFIPILINDCASSTITNCNPESCEMCCMYNKIWTCCNFTELLKDAIDNEHFRNALRNGQNVDHSPDKRITEKTATYDSLRPAAFSIGAIVGIAFGALALFIICGFAIHNCCRLPDQNYIRSIFPRRRGRTMHTLSIPIDSLQAGTGINITISSNNGVQTINYHSHCEDQNEQTSRLTDLPPKYEDLDQSLTANQHQTMLDHELLPSYSSLALNN